MANPQNLKAPFGKGRSAREHHEASVKGAIASNLAKARKKSMRELCEALLSLKPKPEIENAIKKIFPGLDEADITNATGIIASVAKRAIEKGDPKAAAFIRDTAGEKPTTVIDGDINIQKVFVTEKEEQEALKHIKQTIAQADE